MHVARQPDPAHLAQPLGGQLVQHSLGSTDPVGRGLLAPPLMWPMHGQGGSGLGKNRLVLAD